MSRSIAQKPDRSLDLIVTHDSHILSSLLLIRPHYYLTPSSSILLKMPASLTTLASLALLLATSPSLISALLAPQAASTSTPSTITASPSSFNCTPFDISQLRPFDSRFPLYLANLLSYAPPIDQIVPLGFNGSDIDLGRVADRDQGTGFWGFEVCEGLEGVDTTRSVTTCLSERTKTPC